MNQLPMRGWLGERALVDVVAYLHEHHYSGMVRVGWALDSGVIFMREGEVYRCEWGSLAGAEALRALLHIRNEHYSILARHTLQPAQNVSVAIERLLADPRLAHSSAA